uniref:Uncharacterized protein n=1 Tax=Sphaerodactylus townsendi TaxID=933632 RepID=A0ACB8EMQ0_9SAUR
MDYQDSINARRGGEPAASYGVKRRHQGSRLEQVASPEQFPESEDSWAAIRKSVMPNQQLILNFLMAQEESCQRKQSPKSEAEGEKTLRGERAKPLAEMRFHSDASYVSGLERAGEKPRPNSIQPKKGKAEKPTTGMRFSPEASENSPDLRSRCLSSYAGTSADLLEKRNREDLSIMEVVQCRSFEKGNAWLQEWIREELAQGEAWQKQHETLLERQTWLCSLVRAKSLKPLEKKNWAWQKELEETQEALQECQSRRSQCRLQVHKQVRITEGRKCSESPLLTTRDLEGRTWEDEG